MYDCGVNLSDDQYINYVETLKEHSIDGGIKGWIVISNSEKEWIKNLSHCKKYSDSNFIIKTTIGIHPHNAKSVNINSWNNLESIIANNKNIVAIGECGLDYNRMFSPKDIQIKIFTEQIELAHKYKLPLYLHERDAHEDFYNILSIYKIKYPDLRGIVHCFTGNKTNMEKYLELGFYIGITGWLCDNRRNKDLILAVKDLPLEKLILESDSPYLIPISYSKKYDTRRNQPDSLSYVVDKISKITQEKHQDIMKMASTNTKTLFDLY
jgi:TatD DNase family protein